VIQELELLSKTPEQLQVNNTDNFIRLIYKSHPQRITPYVSRRLSRHREKWFYTLPEAVEYVSQCLRDQIEEAVRLMHQLQLQLASLSVLLDTTKVGNNGI